MPVYVTTIAVGKWEDRKNLAYVPVNEKIDGIRYNPFGVPIQSPGDNAEVRRPHKVEEGNPSYVMYDTDARRDVPIFKIEEQ